MNDFEFYGQTRFVFGKNTENQAGGLCKRHGATKIFLHYDGSPFIQSSGLLGRVRASLKEAGLSFIELGGVRSSPSVSLCREGIDLAKKEGVDFILAVGGGSTIDSSKCIALGYYYDGDVWDLCCFKAQPKNCLPVGAVLTMSGTGSEGSSGCVIANDELGIRGGSGFETLAPRFSIINPELQYTLPKYQTASGCTDMFSHAAERYFTNTRDVYITDVLGEAVMRTVVKYAPVALAAPDDYNARSQLAWAAVLAHNDMTGVGREQDWTSHMLGDPLTSIKKKSHGESLAVITPAWMTYVYKHNIQRFARFAAQVWGVEYDVFDPQLTALEGIKQTKEFFSSLGMAVSLTEMGIPESDIPMLVGNVPMPELGGLVKLHKEDYLKIYELAK